MNVASLELCKELYELSGWSNTDNYHCLMATTPKESWVVLDRAASKIRNYPAYDYIYLLNKMPMGHPVSKIYAELRSQRIFKDAWGISWRTEDDEVEVYVESSNIVDAAAKLAIELFKQGILTREGN